MAGDAMRAAIAFVLVALGAGTIASASEPAREPEPEPRVELNLADYDTLAALPTVGDAFAQRIIDGRPYTEKIQLVTRRIVPRAVYARIKHLVVADQEPEYLALR
jgi:competence protein ComEA